MVEERGEGWVELLLGVDGWHGHVREEVVAVVLGGDDEAVLTRDGKVLFQGQMYSQYRAN